MVNKVDQICVSGERESHESACHGGGVDTKKPYIFVRAGCGRDQLASDQEVAPGNSPVIAHVKVRVTPNRKCVRIHAGFIAGRGIAVISCGPVYSCVFLFRVIFDFCHTLLFVQQKALSDNEVEKANGIFTFGRPSVLKGW